MRRMYTVLLLLLVVAVVCCCTTTSLDYCIKRACVSVSTTTCCTGGVGRLLVEALLLLYQLRIDAAVRKQLVVLADLDHAALAQYDDLVGVAHRTEPMCNHEHRAALHELLQGLLHQLLTRRVETRCRFVLWRRE